MTGKKEIPMRIVQFPNLSNDDRDVPISVSLYCPGDTEEPSEKPMQAAVYGVLRDLRKADRNALIEYMRSNGYQDLGFTATGMEIGQIAKISVAEMRRNGGKDLAFQSKLIEINRSLAVFHDRGILTCNALASGLIGLLLQVHGSEMDVITRDNLREITKEGRRFDLKLRPDFIDRYSRRDRVPIEPSENGQIQITPGGIVFRGDGAEAGELKFRIALKAHENQHCKVMREALASALQKRDAKSLRQIADFLNGQSTGGFTVEIRHMPEFNTEVAFGFRWAINRETGARCAVFQVGDQALRGADPIAHVKLSIIGCLAQVLALSEGRNLAGLGAIELLHWVRKIGYTGQWLGQ